jgi:hypothetical protein
MPFTSHTSQHNNKTYRAKLAQAVQTIYRIYTGCTRSVVQGQNRLDYTAVSKTDYLLGGIEIWLRKFVRNFQSP